MAAMSQSGAFISMVHAVIRNLRDHPADPRLNPLELAYQQIPNEVPGILNRRHVLVGIVQPYQLKQMGLYGLGLRGEERPSGWFPYISISYNERRRTLEVQIAHRLLEPVWLAPDLTTFASRTFSSWCCAEFSYGSFEM